MTILRLGRSLWPGRSSIGATRTIISVCAHRGAKRRGRSAGALIRSLEIVRQTTLDHLKRKLLALRKRLVREVNSIKENSLGPRDAASGDVSAMPIHMADIGSDNYDKEFAAGIIAGGETELRDIDSALERMASGEYGVCEECGGQIGQHRLSALPYAKLCIDCQRMEEAESA
jgi:RNA polymerase-binding protein DksA